MQRPSQTDSQSSGDKKLVDGVVDAHDANAESSGVIEYRLYKRRYTGLIGLIILNLVGALSWPWFGPISNDVAAEFDITLDQVNWLGNLVACIYLPVALLVPPFISRYGTRRCCDVAVVCLIISAWVRYAGTVKSLPPKSAYTLLMFGQLFAAIAQPAFQIIGPKFSEDWFSLKGRTTATMIISIANPVGGAIGQLLSPLVGDTRQSILVLGIICTVTTPAVFLIATAPPTPPTYAASQPSPSILSFAKQLIGRGQVEGDHVMTGRERIDFSILFLLFSTLVGASNSFSILTSQILQPQGYSSDTAGFMGACLLLAGIVGAIVTAPLFDRVFTHHLAITAKLLVPIATASWFSMIWAVKPNNTAGLYAIMALIGISSLPMLPVALELGCDLTRNSDGSSSFLWFGGNLFGVMFILVEGALRADEAADPPLNMKRALIFAGSFIMATCSSVFLLRGQQVRKDLDECKLKESRAFLASQQTTEP